MTTLIDELTAKFLPQLSIHQHVFCPAYEQPHGGQLRDYCDLLSELATNEERRLRHSIPASYFEVQEPYSYAVSPKNSSYHFIAGVQASFGEPSGQPGPQAPAAASEG